MSPSPNNLTWNAMLVLRALGLGHRYGFDLMRVTELPSGTIYPILRRLEASGLVRSRWEEDDTAQSEGRPRRRYYAPTAEGRAALAEGLERIQAQSRLLDLPASGQT
jgi:PadR family transcriptional regulator, regulatory protein PadR